ncbi:PREDICTED: AAA-ATPase ASD, mitochondrial-like [Nelumbo nucifera]|uniref:AAA-ATPase ASD, mitochondrial-like n=2 Tax=Nelumbo nucifera TaxID=4432 RepID=A0A1U7ZNZ5_NELNU|nr:PREDICTED: AAA-ATPase ASD, mitochondrial-like [Nelumbo nucifera]DAD34757.1 TPA_asm: hypothetical protein HUJ06_005397 [Nelumbo nucifera]
MEHIPAPAAHQRQGRMMVSGDMWAQLGSGIAGIMFMYAMFQQYFPRQLTGFIGFYTNKLVAFVYPYLTISFDEYSGDRFKRNDVYSAIESYLTFNSTMSAKRLKADIDKNSKNFVLSMDDNEEVTDEFNGVKLWWSSNNRSTPTQSFPFYYAPSASERRFYKLTFHRRHRDLITRSYLNHVLDHGKAVRLQNRQRKLFTNNPSSNWYGYKSTVWNHVVFEHPATFDTLAMDPVKKQDIIDDLLTFSKGKDYYKKIGKAWKRGYLLYGPPGTGKSTMIAAMANLLDYDVYDVELTAVKNNTELRKLLIETSSKSIIVIEDIDCSLDLTGQRKKKKEEGDDDEKDRLPKPLKEEAREKDSKVTLSGLLNFIDGLWSACGGERLIVFTTNHVEKLDPALIRKGRMDKHIQLSYCSYEAFKILAKNYLNLDSHRLFGTIGRLLEETNMTPADVAECLMPKTIGVDADTTCLENLINALETAKEEARLKAEEEEEEAKKKDEASAKEKDEASAKEKEESSIKEENGIVVQEKEKEKETNEKKQD